MFDKLYHPIDQKEVSIQDPFWTKVRNLIQTEAIPYQWGALNDAIEAAEPSHCITNFHIAAGHESGNFEGFVFQDTDLSKWLEAVAYLLEKKPESDWGSVADTAIELIEAAQQEDGYLNTYFTVKEPNGRWSNLRECHELYTAGHLIEAAVAYYEATGKRKLLDVACRLADHIDSVFGHGESKLHGYDGHQEIELALVKLYEVTDNETYLNLAKYFIDERGKLPYFFDQESEKRGHTKHFEGTFMYEKTYNQTHLPVREQSEAVGHAVRAVYMYTAMADLAGMTKDPELFNACKRLWNNIVNKKLYITGAIGSTYKGEAFTFDYDLPNDTVYGETCASIGLIFFAKRMLKLELKSEYADVLERALYNTVLSGMALDGKSFFYVNPLEVQPEACEKDPNKEHVKAVRQKWFGCSCCPPNISRVILDLGSYIYSSAEDTLAVHLYVSGNSNFNVNGKSVSITTTTEYPWKNTVRFQIEPETSTSFKLALRIPHWSTSYNLLLNDASIEGYLKDGYVYLDKLWNKGDILELQLDMEVKIIRSNPKVRENIGKVALQMGPVVYCLEETDNGADLHNIEINSTTKWVKIYEPDELGGVIVLHGHGTRIDQESWGHNLYNAKALIKKEIEVKAIPYFTWGNRVPGEMLCWIHSEIK